MANRNQESTESKQTYLREHIPQSEYEDFAQYCQGACGDVDIQGWSMTYVQTLVQQFRSHKIQKQRASKLQKHQSFYSYQTGNEKELKQLREQLKKEAKPQPTKEEYIVKGQQNEDSTKEKEKPSGTLVDGKTQQKSAMQLLDEIFDKGKPSPTQFETKKYDKSFFQSTNFWEVPSVGEKKPVQPSTLSINSKPMEDNNFQQVFTTGLNISPKPSPVIEKQPIQRENMQRKPSPKIQRKDGIKEEVEKEKKTREWTLVEIPIEEEDAGKTAKSLAVLQREKELPNKKSTVKLKSVKVIKSAQKSKIPYQGQILIKKSFKDKVACFKSFQRMNLSSKDLSAYIIDHEIIERSFFSSNYPMFHLRVEPAHIICKRNYEDFQKLKRSLEGVYPGIRLPYMEKAGWLESQTSPEYIARQKKYLAYFLEDVISHSELRNSRILEDFLTLKDHKSMKRKFEEFQKIKSVSSIQQLCLLEGEVNVEISENHRQYNQMLPKLLQKMNSFWERQEGLVEQIRSLYQSLTDNYSKWGEAIEQIKKEIQDFNRRVAFREFQSMESSLANLYRYVTECQNINQNEAKFLKTDFTPPFRYERQNMNLLKRITQVQESLARAYLKRRQTEESQDTIQYLSERLKDYKENILEESKHFTVLKYQCGYMNEVATMEAERYFNRLSKKFDRVVSDVCYTKLGMLSQSINVYTELVIS